MEKWRGIFKLVEEMGELNRILGKLMAFPNGDDHPGGENLIAQLLLELGDVKAAIAYFEVANIGDLTLLTVQARTDQKFQLFKKWKLSGVPAGRSILYPDAIQLVRQFDSTDRTDDGHVVRMTVDNIVQELERRERDG